MERYTSPSKLESIIAYEFQVKENVPIRAFGGLKRF